MRKYEVIFIVKPMEEDATNAVIDKFSKLIADNGGTIDKEDRWGKKRLAYEIKDCTEPGTCFNPWWNILNRGIGTLGYKGNWNLFDQIIFTDYFLRNYDSKDKPTLTYSRAEVLNRKFLRSSEFLNGYSDHFPTMIYLVKEVK